MAQILRDKCYEICQCSFFEELSPYIKHGLDKYIKEFKASQQLPMDDECEASPKLTSIIENDSNIETKSFPKASDNSNVKLSGVISKNNNILDYSTPDKEGVAKCKTRKRGLSNANDKIKECNVSPKLTMISDTGSNSGTKDIFKVSDNSNVKVTGVILEKNNILDYDTLDKTSYAKSKARKRGLSNADDKIKECNVSPNLTMISDTGSNSGTKGIFKVSERLLRIERNYEESVHSLLQYGDIRDYENDNSSLDDTLEYCVDNTQVSSNLNQ